MEFEYLLFGKDNPIDYLKKYASDLTLAQKRKVSPYIKRADGLTKSVKKFRAFLLEEELLHELISSCFMIYFDNYINKNKYLVVPRDAAYDFTKFFKTVVKPSNEVPDKYLKRAESMIALHRESIDPFIKAFLAIRTAQSEIAKVKSP
jgi:hypothetical protein